MEKEDTVVDVLLVILVVIPDSHFAGVPLGHTYSCMCASNSLPGLTEKQFSQ